MTVSVRLFCEVLQETECLARDSFPRSDSNLLRRIYICEFTIAYTNIRVNFHF